MARGTEVVLIVTRPFTGHRPISETESAECQLLCDWPSMRVQSSHDGSKLLCVLQWLDQTTNIL